MLLCSEHVKGTRTKNFYQTNNMNFEIESNEIIIFWADTSNCTMEEIPKEKEKERKQTSAEERNPISAA